MNKIPGYESIAAFEREMGLPEGTGKRHMQRGYCKWPRKTNIDGRADHPLYTRWRSIIDRTTVKGHTSYKNYGGRGIRIDPEWFADFWRFVRDIKSLGPPPTPAHTLDRINNDGDYVIANLRWASKTEQNFNQRLHSDNTSGRRGLSYSKRDGVWRVQRQEHGVTTRLSFRTRADADAYLDSRTGGNKC